MRSLASLLLALALLAPGTGRGEVGCADTAAPPAVAAVPVERRIAFLRQALEAERDPARNWSWTFGAVNGALAAGQLAGAVAVTDEADKAILAAGAATSSLAVAFIVLAPIAPSERDLAPAGGDRCADLRRLESALSRGARNQRLGTGASAQLGNLLINVGFGVAVGLQARRPGPGLATFALGWGLGEVQIRTQPTGLIHALDRYQSGELDALGGAAPSRSRWQVLMGRSTIAIRMSF